MQGSLSTLGFSWIWVCSMTKQNFGNHGSSLILLLKSSNWIHLWKFCWIYELLLQFWFGSLRGTSWITSSYFGPNLQPLSHNFYQDVAQMLILPSAVFVSTQEKGAKEQWDKLSCEKAFVRTKESVWHQSKDCVGGTTCWSSKSLYDQCNCPMIFSIE